MLFFLFDSLKVSSIEPLSCFPVFASGLAVLILPFLVCHSLLFTRSIKRDSSQHSAEQSSCEDGMANKMGHISCMLYQKLSL